MTPSKRTVSSTSRADGTMPGVNDHPRNPHSANFEARRADAHRRGLWLTDELNRYPGHALSVHGSRHTSNVTVNPCTTDCGGGDGGGGTTTGFIGGGGSSPAWYDSLSSSSPYDTELDFSDGTSILTLQLDQNQIGTLEVNGYVTAYGFNAYMQIDSTKSMYCQLMYGVDNCLVPPKWMCPYISTTYGVVAALAAVAATKNPTAQSVVGAFVTNAVQQLCEQLNAYEQWPSLKNRVALISNSSRS